MPDHVVTDEKGQVHRFPEEATPEMIAQALGVSPPAPAAPNLKTGEGMEQQAVQQSHRLFTGGTPNNPIGSAKPTYSGAPPSLLQKAGDEQNYNQTRLGAAQNRAARSPTPFSSAVSAYAPVAAAKSIAGAKIGGMAGKALAGQSGQVVGGLAGGILGGVPWDRPTLGKAVIDPNTLKPRAGLKLIPWMNEERATALGDVIDPNLPKVRNMVQAAEQSMPNRIEELANQGKQETLLGQENAAAIKRMPPEPPPWQQPSHQEIPLGSPEYPGPFNKVPNKLPNKLRGDPFNPTQPPAQTPFTAPMEAPSAEGVKGSVPKPSGRLVLLPQEAQAVDRLQSIAKTRASQHGMQYAAGMRPAGGGRVPLTPTGTTTTEFPGPRPQASPLPWETQGVNVTAPPLKVENAMGIRWASDGANKVSIPDSVPDEGIESFARPKLAEQAQIRANLPWMKGAQ